MSTQPQVTTGEDILALSDEELLNLDLSLLNADGAAAASGEAGEGEGAAEAPAAGAAGGPEAGAATETDADGEDEGNAPEGAADGDETTDPEAGAAAPAAGASEAKQDGPAQQEGQDAKPETDPAAAEAAKPLTADEFMARITAPFKANGRDMQVDNPDDAIRLMQMGANYNKKMAALKPSLKTLKLLENNDLLDEEKLSFLIDLSKNDRGAIAKLIKDSGIDPLEINDDSAAGYKPTTKRVDDRELVLDEVLSDIRETPTYNRTLEVVTSKWDEKSKQTVANAPQLLKVINDHMASGVYELVSQEVERERVLGRLEGLTDLEAYRQVGDAINARGGFNHLAPGGNQQPAAKIVTPKEKATDPKLNDQRRAASPPKQAAPGKPATAKDFNPLALSDEDFEKQLQAKFL